MNLNLLTEAVLRFLGCRVYLVCDNAVVQLLRQFCRTVPFHSAVLLIARLLLSNPDIMYCSA